MVNRHDCAVRACSAVLVAESLLPCQIYAYGIAIRSCGMSDANADFVSLFCFKDIHALDLLLKRRPTTVSAMASELCVRLSREDSLNLWLSLFVVARCL